MKRSTLYMAIVALTLVSCSKNEVKENPINPSDPKVMNFNLSTGTTRATSNDIDAVKTGFNILGYKANASTPFIDGTDPKSTYSFVDPKWVWTDVKGKEWPTVDADYPLTFYAEYPKVDMSTNTNLNKAVSVDLDISRQTDILVAKSEVQTRPASGFTPLNFKHILSNLVFKIETRNKYKVVVQSIRVVNTAKSGRTYNYATTAYEAETNYTNNNMATTDGTNNRAEGFYYSKTNWTFTGDANNSLIGDVPSASGIMMQMPQLNIPYWVETNTTNGLGKFQADAKLWSDGTEADIVTKLNAWYTATPSTPTQPGMQGSDGWKGARIEVVYRIYDTEKNISVVGRQTGEKFRKNGVKDQTAERDYFIRVGYPLDLSAIKVESNSKGWEMNKRYTYTIQLGTAKATNGILLDPDYKNDNGDSENPKIEVDNPSANPGDPTTPGLISFTVSVDDWVENSSTGIPVN